MQEGTRQVEPHQGQLFTTTAPLILASGSPRRQRFMRDMGLTFKVVQADIKEEAAAGEPPEQFVKRLALEKAKAVGETFPDSWVVGADTIVVWQDRILGKPADNAEALQTLQMLNGQWHVVWTGLAVIHESKNIIIQHAEATEVKFAEYPNEVLQAYIATGEPLDKAGAYGIQKKGGVLVEKINGSYSNVVGLPLSRLISILLRQRIITIA